MKLIIAVVHDRDRGKITESLLRNNFKFTKIGSTGGFLREGNVTLLLGVDDRRLDECLAIIGEASKTRKQFVNVLPPDAGPVGTFVPSPVEVEVGGAIAFVLPVESFVTF
ncbi:MAG: cyclic-di-AMP receptor [Armatimonadaceae bacterium]